MANPFAPIWYPGQHNSDFIIQPNPQRFANKHIYLTDALRVGIMLRDRRLTLRNHAALTPFVVEVASGTGTEFILHTPNCDGDNYVRIGDKGALRASASKKDAQSFEFRLTPLGLELYLHGQRPAVFDDFYDVSIGKWENDRSRIPILVHLDPDSIWPAQRSRPGGSANPGGGFGNPGGVGSNPGGFGSNPGGFGGNLGGFSGMSQ